MTWATALSIAIASACAVVGALCLGLSRAPGWAVVRWFGVASLLAGLFTITNVAFSLPGVPDRIVFAAGSLGGALAALHVAAWIVYARVRTASRLSVVDRGALFTAFVIAALCLVPDLVYTSHIVDHPVPWWGVSYRIPETTFLALLVYVVLLGLLAHAVAGLWRVSRQTGRGALIRVSVAFFLATAVNEALVAAHLVSSPFLLEVGFAAVIFGVGVELNTKVLTDARALERLTETLDAQVTERTAELARSQEELARAERLAALGRLSAAVGHEVNNPLTYLKLNLSELEEALRDDDDLAPLATEALDGVARIQRIAADLRMLDAGEIADDPAADLGEVLAEALQRVEPSVPRAVALQVDTRDLPRVRGNAQQLTQVFEHLLTNAVAAARSDGSPLNVHTEVDRQGPWVRVSVVDDGVGIPPDLIGRVAEPFVSTKEVHDRSGTGLGLALARAIVTSYGGQLTILSDGETGTRVEVVLGEADGSKSPSS